MLDFDNEVVNSQDAGYKYLRWPMQALLGQCKFREIYQDGMLREDMVHALQDDDEKRGLESDQQIPLFPIELVEAGKCKIAREEFAKPLHTIIVEYI